MIEITTDGIILLSIFLIMLLYLLFIYDVMNLPRSLPNIPFDQYWGLGEAKDFEQDTSIVPFEIKFTKEIIEGLKSKLSDARYTDSLENTRFEYGFNHKTLKLVVDYWRSDYNFSERETYLNQFPQFKTNIQGLDIHFIHVKPVLDNENIDVLPLLMLHGWPGSVMEFYKVIPVLSEMKNEKFVFEIIVPSLPGFGFSQGSSKPGLGTCQMAVVMKNLMERLGHKKFYIQGSDWGSLIGSHMTVLFPSDILGFHSNFPSVFTPKTIFKIILGNFWPSLVIQKRFQHRLYPLSKHFAVTFKESGYFHQQVTKPDTIGVSLDNSPIGLAAWILDVFASTTHREYKILENGGLTEKFTFTELIDNLMFYWVPKSATTAGRIYAESFSEKHLKLNLDNYPTDVPTAIARFPNEVIFSTESMLKEKYVNLLQVTDFSTGGHFPGLEEPQLLANDIKSAVKKFRIFHSENVEKNFF